MAWIIIAIIIVGLLVVGVANTSLARRPQPIAKRIELIKGSIEKYQDYLGKEYKQQLEEERGRRREKDTSGSSGLMWDPDIEKYFQNRYDDLLKFVQLNAILCERLRNDEQRLFEQVCDWGSYLEMLIEISQSHVGDEKYIEADLGIPPTDEVADAKRRGLMQATYERIMARAKAQGVLTKALTPSVL